MLPLQHCHLYDCIEEVIHPTINRDEEVEHLLRPGSPDFHQPGLASVSSHGSLEGLSNQVRMVRRKGFIVTFSFKGNSVGSLDADSWNLKQHF